MHAAQKLCWATHASDKIDAQQGQLTPTMARHKYAPMRTHVYSQDHRSAQLGRVLGRLECARVSTICACGSCQRCHEFRCKIQVSVPNAHIRNAVLKLQCHAIAF